jgi:hypothetical protein
MGGTDTTQRLGEHLEIVATVELETIEQARALESTVNLEISYSYQLLFVAILRAAFGRFGPSDRCLCTFPYFMTLSFTDVCGAACVTKISCKKPVKCYSFGVAEKTLRFKVVIPKVKSLITKGFIQTGISLAIAFCVTIKVIKRFCFSIGQAALVLRYERHLGKRPSLRNDTKLSHHAQAIH